MGAHPFGPGQTGYGLRRSAQALLALPDEEIEALFRETGYSERAIRIEMAAVREYRARTALPPRVPRAMPAGDTFVKSSARRRKHREAGQ